MHTPIEVLALEDMESVAKLLAAFPRPSVKALWDSFDTAASGAQESVDWVLLYYVGTVVLNLSLIHI